MDNHLSGTILSTIFHNDTNGYSVISISTEHEVETVVGCFPIFSEGESVHFYGTWDMHPIYGRQFKANKFEANMPSSLEEIERYLASGIIKGIGKATARLIVQQFGTETFEVLETSPERLMEVYGIGEARYRMMFESLQQTLGTRSAMIFLQKHSIAPGLSQKILRRYGSNTKSILLENPYRLIDDFKGVGFERADKIAQSIGIEHNSTFRMEYGIRYIVRRAALEEGHTCVLQAQLLMQAEELLKVPIDMIHNTTQALLLSGELFLIRLNDKDYITLPYFIESERTIALSLLRLIASSASPTQTDETINRSIELFELNNNLIFSDTQKQAIRLAIQSGVLVISGGPGTGKTTIINCILQLIGKDNTLLAAPTGRAAKRMQEAAGHEAKTIHRLLEYNGEEEAFSYNQDRPLECQCLIIDEVSMVDIFLMRSTLQAVAQGTKLILVGDADQLPSVGPGNVLKDIIDSGTIPTVLLDEIFRQDKDSAIILNAHHIKHGEIPEYLGKDSDFFMVSARGPQNAAQAILSLYTRRLPNYFIEQGVSSDIQVLSPMKKGACGANELNRLLQAEVNPLGKRNEIIYIDTHFRINDRVIHTRNNYSIEWITDEGDMGNGVFNGDIGTIVELDSDAGILLVLFDDGKKVYYDYPQLEDLELAYCLTVHKSQGSEFDAVIVPVIGGPPKLLTKNLFYTAITRAKKLVVLVGSDYHVQQMVTNPYSNNRNTSLAQHLAHYSFMYEEDI